MAVTYSKTREYLRQAIGRNVGKMVTGTTTSSSGSTTQAIDAKLFGGDDEYIGNYIRFTSGDNDGTTARVTDYTANTGKNINVDNAISNTFGFGGHNASLLISKYTN